MLLRDLECFLVFNGSVFCLLGQGCERCPLNAGFESVT